MIERFRSERRHKQVKKWLAAGNTKDAENSLLGERDGLYAQLRYGSPNEDTADYIEFRLLLVYSLLGECYSLKGDVEAADNSFDAALQYWSMSHDPMALQRTYRVRGMHRASCGRFDDALRDLSGVVAEFKTTKFKHATEMSDDRIQIELAFTNGRLAECMLMQYPGQASALVKLDEARQILRYGNKPRYELEILMASIAIASPLTTPLLFERMIARALYLNSRHVSNSAYFAQLVDANTAIPIGSAVRSALGRLTR